MFVGSINSKIRLLIFTEKKLFSERNICIGCSGNFTVEQILQGLDCKIWSNDVALYSSLIGHHLAGNHSCLEIRDPRYSWIEPYIAKGGVDRIAAVALLFEMLKNEKGNNLQQSRMWAHYRENFEKFHEKSCARIAKTLSAIRISRYTTVDAHDLYRDLPKDWIRVAFLPTYVGGYEKLYECLDKIFSWDAPAYQVLTKERYEATLAFMRRGQYLYLSDYDRKEEGLFAIVKTGRLRNVYLYSNMPFKKSYVIPHAKSVPGGFALLPPDHPITQESRIEFRKADNQRMNYYKNLFLKKGIDHTTGVSPLFVFLDGYLFGFLLFDVIRYGMDQDRATRGVYMLSDFVIASPISRLSKLLLLATKTGELRQILKEKFLQAVDFILTTAFTDKPVSMKYRGVYDLMKRSSITSCLRLILCVRSRSLRSHPWSIRSALPPTGSPTLSSCSGVPPKRRRRSASTSIMQSTTKATIRIWFTAAASCLPRRAGIWRFGEKKYLSNIAWCPKCFFPSIPMSRL
jgi:hypothetical protein